jgi:hypothetical protein
VADQVRPSTEDLGDVLGVHLEVLALGGWAVAEAATVDKQQAVEVGERSLFGPGLLPQLGPLPCTITTGSP